MAWVYVLHNELTDRYVGSTIDLSRRLRQHNANNTKTTRRLGTKTLVYSEQYNTEIEARIREKQIKSYKSKNYIKEFVHMGR